MAGFLSEEYTLQVRGGLAPAVRGLPDGGFFK